MNRTLVCDKISMLYIHTHTFYYCFYSRFFFIIIIICRMGNLKPYRKYIVVVFDLTARVNFKVKFRINLCAKIRLILAAMKKKWNKNKNPIYSDYIFAYIWVIPPTITFNYVQSYESCFPIFINLQLYPHNRNILALDLLNKI